MTRRASRARSVLAAAALVLLAGLCLTGCSGRDDDAARERHPVPKADASTASREATPSASAMTDPHVGAALERLRLRLAHVLDERRREPRTWPVRRG